MKKLIIFGKGILARIALFYFNRDSRYEVAGFTVNQIYIDSNKFCDLEVFPFESIEDTHPPSEFKMFVAIGPSKMNAVRENKFLEAKAKKYNCVSYISPHSICDSPVGENSFVGDMTIIHPFVSIGYNNFFWEKVFIGNDSHIENNCYFSPLSTIGTFSRIESNSILGTGSIVKTGVHVSTKTLIGASCYISKNTHKDGVYAQRNSEFLGQCSGKINISI